MCERHLGFRCGPEDSGASPGWPSRVWAPAPPPVSATPVGCLTGTRSKRLGLASSAGETQDAVPQRATGSACHFVPHRAIFSGDLAVFVTLGPREIVFTQRVVCARVPRGRSSEAEHQLPKLEIQRRAPGRPQLSLAKRHPRRQRRRLRTPETVGPIEAPPEYLVAGPSPWASALITLSDQGEWQEVVEGPRRHQECVHAQYGSRSRAETGPEVTWRCAPYRTRLVDPLLDTLMAAQPAVLLVGPRAAGKTTTASRRAATTVRLDRAAEAGAFVADPDAALRDLPEPILLDEWQQVPGVLGAVKRAVDGDPRPGRFLITGSVRGDLTGETWPGTGRVVRVTLQTLSMREQLGRIDAPAFLDQLATGHTPSRPMDPPDLRGYVELAFRGGFPSVLDQTQDLRESWLESYVDQIITRDAVSLAGLRDPSASGATCRRMP